MIPKTGVSPESCASAGAADAATMPTHIAKATPVRASMAFAFLGVPAGRWLQNCVGTVTVQWPLVRQADLAARIDGPLLDGPPGPSGSSSNFPACGSERVVGPHPMN